MSIVVEAGCGHEKILGFHVTVKIARSVNMVKA